ncbi:MAG: hypothetical protein MI743_17915 [Sneathiellales bacterium]|nr:hypothetical protein [Sneathiellales bacterium]
MSDTDQKSVDSVLQNIIATDEESASDLGALSDELVDLDALFDALNVAVAEGGDAVDFKAGETSGGGILTVKNEALAAAGVSSSVDELISVADDVSYADSIISDES